MLHFQAIEPFDIFTRRLISDMGETAFPDVALSGTGALHDLAFTLNWDCYGPSEILALAEHPDASRATVLLLYWRNCAGFYLQYAERTDVPEDDLEGYDLGQALEQLFENKPDRSDGIGYDPRKDNCCDRTTLYADMPQRRATPAHMLVAVPGTIRPPLADMDWDGRPPTSTERTAIAAGIARGRGLLPGLPAGAAGRDVILAIEAAMRGPGPVDDDLAWLWLEQLGWDWECADNPADGVLFGVCRGGVSLVVPDIVRNTLKAGVDPSRVVAAFDLLIQPRTFDTAWRIEHLVGSEFPFAAIDHPNFDYPIFKPGS